MTNNSKKAVVTTSASIKLFDTYVHDCPEFLGGKSDTVRTAEAYAEKAKELLTAVGGGNGSNGIDNVRMRVEVETLGTHNKVGLFCDYDPNDRDSARNAFAIYGFYKHSREADDAAHDVYLMRTYSAYLRKIERIAGIVEKYDKCGLLVESNRKEIMDAWEAAHPEEQEHARQWPELVREPVEPVEPVEGEN